MKTGVFRALAALLAVVAVSAQAPVASLVILDARIYSGDPARPGADAIAVAGDRVLAVGFTTEIRRLTGSSTRVLDGRGALVTPGFNDAHVHVDATGAQRNPSALLKAKVLWTIVGGRVVHGGSGPG